MRLAAECVHTIPKGEYAITLAASYRLMKLAVLTERHSGLNKNIRRAKINESICNSFDRRIGDCSNLRYLRRYK